ncbi:MAG TPA: serine/threonine-protein kinase, partial [Kofleriaceae bacterium]|nr:serine/threonine-protein kinase [Kofleriaceae bacterium]
TENTALNAALLATGMPPPADSLALGATLTSLAPKGLTPSTRVAPPTLQPGQLFDGRYRIEARIGRGGPATVYRAQHVALHEPRAIKLLHPESLETPGAVEQLRREVDATSRIHHPNVVQLHDFGRSVEGHYYLSLELVDGESLAATLHRDGPLPVARALAYARGILGALQAAHQLHLIHRDLKPGNVLIDRRDQPRVTDFGMAQSLHDYRSAHDTIAGTPAYMSPEQCDGKPLDGRTDLYSFGVTLYHMLSGALPYRDTSGDPFKLALSTDRVPLEQRVPALAPELVTTVARCLAIDPAARPPSALAVLRELETL